jgi:hypothetical protein
LKLYCNIVRPALTYGCEAWGLKGTVKRKSMVFERKMLRIFDSTKETDGTRRIKTNDELDKVIRRKNTIKSHKSAKINLARPFYIECQKREW